VDSNLVSSNLLDGNGVKAMLGLIPAPKSNSLKKNKKNTISQMGHTKKCLKKYLATHLGVKIGIMSIDMRKLAAP